MFVEIRASRRSPGEVRDPALLAAHGLVHRLRRSPPRRESGIGDPAGEPGAGSRRREDGRQNAGDARRPPLGPDGDEGGDRESACEGQRHPDRADPIEDRQHDEARQGTPDQIEGVGPLRVLGSPVDPGDQRSQQHERRTPRGDQSPKSPVDEQRRVEQKERQGERGQSPGDILAIMVMPPVRPEASAGSQAEHGKRDRDRGEMIRKDIRENAPENDLVGKSREGEPENQRKSLTSRRRARRR